MTLKTHDENTERIYRYLRVMLIESENELSAFFWLYGLYVWKSLFILQQCVLMIFYQILIIIFKGLSLIISMCLIALIIEPNLGC